MAASESADQALSGPVSSIKIGSRVWKLGDPIHSVGIAAVEKKKMVELLAINMRLQELKESFWGVVLGRNIV